MYIIKQHTKIEKDQFKVLKVLTNAFILHTTGLSWAIHIGDYCSNQLLILFLI